jgi:hypothetical protein
LTFFLFLDKKKKYFNINVKGELTPYGLIHEKKNETTTEAIKETRKRQRNSTTCLLLCQSTLPSSMEEGRDEQKCKKTEDLVQETFVEEAFQKCLAKCRSSSRLSHQRYFDTIKKDTLPIYEGKKSQFNPK